MVSNPVPLQPKQSTSPAKESGNLKEGRYRSGSVTSGVDCEIVHDSERKLSNNFLHNVKIIALSLANIY